MQVEVEKQLLCFSKYKFRKSRGSRAANFTYVSMIYLSRLTSGDTTFLIANDEFYEKNIFLSGDDWFYLQFRNF